MQKLAFIFPIILLASFIVSLPARASDREQDAGGMAYIECLHKAARTLDDNVSPADTIAIGIIPLCATQHRQYVDLLERQMPFEAKRSFEQKIKRDDLQIATSIVLNERRLNKEKNIKEDEEADAIAKEVTKLPSDTAH
jgi:hypothetical protein